MVGAPLDCSGTNRGEARAPEALRDAGLVQRTGVRDAGDADAMIDDPQRDAHTGVSGSCPLVRFQSRSVRGRDPENGSSSGSNADNTGQYLAEC